MSVHGCTIVARNYLPAARVLATSFREHHPDGSFTTLVIDDLYGLVDDAQEPFRVMRLQEIGLSEEEFLRMAAIYTVMEFSTAVKPWLLKCLLDEGAVAVLYIDPDIKIYAPLDELSVLAEQHRIVLTPHVTEPLPRDKLRTSESELLGSGMYNLGFIGVGQGNEAFFDYWMERLRRECIVEPAAMRFVDQRWIDFVPGMFDAKIIRDPTYNVAYWNLSGRRVTLTNGAYRVNGEPLHFFHFSGYDPDVPYLLSKHQGATPRILLSEHPDLRRLCDEYGADLLARRYREEIKTEYGFARLANGVRFDPVMRKLYRDALEESESRPGGEQPPNPLDPKEHQSFIDWLNEIPAGSPGARLTRYLLATYEGRTDLHVAFPDVGGEDYDTFVRWTRHEVAEGRLDKNFAVIEFASRAQGHGTGDPNERPGVPGIRVAGYLQAETGVGELGRLAIAAVRAAGIEHGTFLDTHSVSRQDQQFEASERNDLTVNLVCVNADELGNFARRVGPSFFEGRYTIGIWAWEIEEFPHRFDYAFQLVDEIWAISEFTRAAIAANTSKPVYAFPLPIVAPEPAAAGEIGSGDASGAFTFLFCFDLMSVIERKNPFGLIEAFSRAFKPGDGARLIIKAVNNSMKMNDLERLRFALEDHPHVELIDHYLGAAENAALMSSCDCYVSLHRSEGFGLTMAEAMSLGKPVIATGYSGNVDFMTSETSYLVPYSLVPVGSGSEPYPPTALWAEPNLDEAARLMRFVYEHPDEAAEVGHRARAHVRSQHGVEARTAFVKERFAYAQRAVEQGSITPKPVVWGGLPKMASGEPELIVLARGNPSIEAPSRFGGASKLVRRFVQRLLRHHDSYQRELNMKLALGIEHVARVVSDLQSDLDAVRAIALRQTDADLIEAVASNSKALEQHGERLREQAKLLKDIAALLESNSRSAADA